ncbi:MAG: glycosyltransferase [Vampirovibrionia bacterium]
MSQYPLISVIIPVYNTEKYIEQALNSVLDEDYPNKEIVIINDGSTDNTAYVIENWINRHKNDINIIFKSRKNKGVTKTLNELIDISNGEYIVFFGSDDCLKNNGISKRYEYLTQYPDKLMVWADCDVIDSNGNILFTSALVSIGNANKKLLLSDDGLKKYMTLNGYSPGATLMAKKKVYEMLGKYDESLHTEDWVYLIKACAYNVLGYVDETVASYRLHKSNTCYSEKLILIAQEQLQVAIKSPRYFKEFKYKFYLLLKIVYMLIFIPYLSLKMKLLGLSEKYKQQKILGIIFKSLLHISEFIKNIFIFLTNKIFDKKGKSK